jgi:ammonia channel protein AmtB
MIILKVLAVIAIAWVVWALICYGLMFEDVIRAFFRDVVFGEFEDD